MKTYMFLFFVFQNLFVFAQVSNSYDIMVSGNTIGCLDVSKKTVGTKTIYSIDSESNIELFKKTEVKTHQEAVFENGELVSSLSETYKNGNVFETAKTEKNGNGYIFSKKGDVSKISKPISYSAVLLFFQKPTLVNQIFSESDGVFKKIKNTGNDIFELAASGYHTNKYIYKNGNLQEVSLRHLFFDVTVKLNP